MPTEFKNRVFGCAIIKAINSNYNADFTHQPRTLPDGVVYATDKALKYTIKYYLLKNYPNEKIFNFKRLSESMNPFDLAGAYRSMFNAEVKDNDRDTILKNLLSCIDIRSFGATFAPKGTGIEDKNISIHGTVQINHGVNRFPENSIYSEQIMSPFRNPGEEGSEEKGMTTLGTQSKLKEGHYVHHFSINPKNMEDHFTRVGDSNLMLSNDDINKVKEAMRRGATYYDSASKAGTENELLIWVQLKPDSKLILPNFTDLIDVTRVESKVKIDLKRLQDELSKSNVKDEIEKIEFFYNDTNTEILNLPENISKSEL